MAAGRWWTRINATNHRYYEFIGKGRNGARVSREKLNDPQIKGGHLVRTRSRGDYSSFLGEKSARFVAVKVNAAPGRCVQSFSRKGNIVGYREPRGVLCGFIFQQTRLFNQYPAVHPIQCQRTPILWRTSVTVTGSARRNLCRFNFPPTP